MVILKRLIIILLILFFISSMTKNFLSFTNNLAFYQNFRQEYEKEKKKNNELKMMAVRSTDSFEVEKMIRNKLNMVKKDETIVILPNPTPEPQAIAPTSIPTYQQWWNTFFKN